MLHHRCFQRELCRFTFRGRLLTHEARSRRGFTLVELIVTMVLLGTVMVTVVPLLGWVNIQRRAADVRLFAGQETANILERFTIRYWDEITQKSADKIEISDQTAQLLKELSLKVTVLEMDSELPSKRITVELSWNNRAGDRVTPARLTSFVYKQSESK
jgi:prepilin-type N-terminal cleavage/methylation domain-containing protein